MVSSIGHQDFLRICSSFRRYDGVYIGWFILDFVWRIFMMEASKLSIEVTRALILLALPLALCSKSTSVSSGIHMWVKSVHCVFFCSFSGLFQHFDLVTTYLKAGLGSKSLSIGLCFVDQGCTIQFFWDWNLTSWFFVFIWLFVCADGINKRGRCHAGGRVPSLPLLALDPVNVDQGSMIRFVESGITFLGYFLFSG